MNFNHSLLITFFLFSSLLSACSKCVYPDATTVVAPGWVCTGKTNGIKHSAVGFADKSAAGNAFMKQQAATKARVALANSMKGNVNNMVESTPDKSSTRLIKETLINSKVIDTSTSPNGRLYVLVGIVTDKE